MKETAEDIIKRLNGLLLDQSQRQVMLERHFFMYGHSTLSGGGGPVFSFDNGRVRLNLVQSCAQTLLNKVTKNLPRATFLTDGGDWDKQQQAKKREKFVYGQFHKSKTYEATPVTGLNSLVFGDGYTKAYADGKEIKTDPVLTMSVVVDEAECLYGPPRTFFEIRYMDKDTLKEMYPEKEKQIDELQTIIMPFYMSGTVKRNLVQVVEYWRLSITEDSHGDHRIIAGKGLELLKEEWKKKRPPFRRLSFVKNLVGYYSKGVAECVTPYQLEANKTLMRISDALRLVASPKVLYEYQSKIVQAHFNNDVGAMIGYMGTPPQFIMPTAVSPELFSHLAWCTQGAYQEVGISQLSANSQKPAGLNSGKALREYQDIETERFAAFEKAWEQHHVDLAEDCLEIAKEIQEKHGKYSVLSPDPKGCEIVDFSEVGEGNDDYLIQVYPTSQLPKDPAGRLEYVTELMSVQMLSPEEGLSLLDFPDTEKITSLKTSELDDIMHTVDYMLTKDKFLAPEPFQNLELGIQLMKKSYLKYKNQGCPDKKLDLLIRWINEALVLTTPPENFTPPITGDELTPPGASAPAVESLPPEELLPEMEALPPTM
jgi:hypothetical protein